MECKTNHQADGYELHLPSVFGALVRNTWQKTRLNLYHARAPRFRLMGEFVRDNALSIRRTAQPDIWRPRGKALPTTRTLERSFSKWRPKICSG